MYKPLTKEQYQKAIDSGFSSEQIVEMEKQRKEKSFQTVQSTISQKTTPGIMENLGQVAVGAGKGALSTLTGISSLTERGLKTVLPRQAEKFLGLEPDKTVAETIIPEKYRTPEGTAQQIGFGAEQIAEFLVPASKIAKVEKLTIEAIKGAKALPSLAKKVLPLASRMGTEAVAFGGQRALQKGKIDDDVKTTAIIGGLFPVPGIAISKTKGLLKSFGEKIQQTVIRPTARDLKNGFKISNVNKYNLGGSLQETMTKTHIKLNELTNKLTSLLKISDKKVNLNQVFQETTDEINRQKTRYFGDIGANNRVLNSLKDELTQAIGKKGIVDLVQATYIKRGAGTKGAWSFGRFEPDSSATEIVYNVFYNKLKTAIERAASPGIKEINKQISELIPISNAVLRRIPVAERNNVIGLTDSIGLFAAAFNPKALALIGAQNLAKSGRFGAFLTKLGSPKTSRTAIGQRFFGQ